MSAVESLKNSYNLTAYQSKKCDEFFAVMQPGDFIYPGHLKSKLLLDIKTAYLFMEDLKKEGFVTNIYEVYCKQCHKSKGIFLYNLFTDPRFMLQMQQICFIITTVYI